MSLQRGCILLLILFSYPLQAQEKFVYDPWSIDTLIIAKKQFLAHQLPDWHRILEQSLQLKLNRNYLYIRQDYKFDRNSNALEFFTPINTGDSLQIQYNILPISLKRKYAYFEFDTLSSAISDTDSVAVLTHKIENPFADIGGNLKRSGSIVRGVNIGSNKDLTLNSGLNLQLSGYLTDDLEVVAALTDESTPIQPEGNTQTLREVDKVFIQFKSPWVRGTLGDFNLKYEGSYFGSVSRKLQGINLTGIYDKYELGGTVASTRGFFCFNSFTGKEGNQGPYQLTGKNGEREIIVLAGTERIWMNGEKLVRGENNDYIIEYGNGQITFSNRRMVTGESRIEVDFEYYPALQKYTRNVYSGKTTGSIINDNLQYKVTYYQEYDNPDKLLESEQILSDTEKEILKSVGDDAFNAQTSSANYVGDSLGFYIKIDTTINSSVYSYYKYVGRNIGDYNVSFSSVEQGKGDYIRDRLGVYRWVNIGKGNYLPVRLLPLPNRQQLADFQLQVKPWKPFTISGEYALSRFDRNVLSSIDDSDNQGGAFQLAADLELVPIKFADQSLGKFAFSANGRFIDDNFQSVDRYNKPDFRRYWNILDKNEKSNSEKSIELNSTYYPWEWLKINGNLGTLEKNLLKSFRYQTDVEWDKANWFRVNLKQELVKSKQQENSDNWLRQKGKLEKDIGYFQPGILLEREQRKRKSAGNPSGFEFHDFGSRLGFIKHSHLSGYLQYNHRTDDVFVSELDGKKRKQSTTETKQIRIDLAEWNRTSGYLEIVSRKKNYTPYFENTEISFNKILYADVLVQDTSWQDRETNLAELVLNNYQWNRAFDVRWQYRISTEQLALREKIYIDVGQGRGSIRYDEDLEEYLPDPDGNLVLYIIPSGKFEPVTNLETSIRMKLDPSMHWKNPGNEFQKILSKLSSETYIRVDEQTKEKELKDIYLLNMSKFQQENTLKGSIILNEDINILRRNSDLSFRLRYRYRDDRYNQFLDPNENEDRQTVERGIQSNYLISQKLRGQSEFRQNFIKRDKKSNSAHNRDINSIIINQNLSYRPDMNWEFGIESENGFERDDALSKDLKVLYNQIRLRANYSILKKGRITADYEYHVVKVTNNPMNASIPFEMARGKKEGISKIWQLRGDYTIAENVVVSLFYSGRDDANFDQVIHSGQAEIKAYF